MSQLNVLLFGKLSVRCNEDPVQGLTGSKVQELFCYLLLHRDRPHPRETLAALLWGDTPTTQSKKYLRQALWQLQTALNGQACEGGILRIEPDWVGLNAAADLWLDAAVFEQAHRLSQEMTCSQMEAVHADALRSAIDLYQGDLLEGWYQDWCLSERERLQEIHLGMLDKLMDYCAVHHDYENGMGYGARILRYDKARECTHQRLMRLRYLAGDRAGALRQYDRCLVALDEELGVRPSEITIALHQEISAGRLRAVSPVSSTGGGGSEATALADVLGRLRQIEVTLGGIQQQLHADIQIVETALHRETLDGVQRRAPVRSVLGARDSARQKAAARG